MRSAKLESSISHDPTLLARLLLETVVDSVLLSFSALDWLILKQTSDSSWVDATLACSNEVSGQPRVAVPEGPAEASLVELTLSLRASLFDSAYSGAMKSVSSMNLQYCQSLSNHRESLYEETSMLDTHSPFLGVLPPSFNPSKCR